MNSQLGDLLTAYGLSAAGMLAGLLLMRADSRAYFRWPVYSAMVMALVAMSWSLLIKPLVPPRWQLLHGTTVYFCAMGLYAVMGFALGLLLGRLTGRKTSDADQ